MASRSPAAAALRAKAGQAKVAAPAAAVAAAPWRKARRSAGEEISVEGVLLVMGALLFLAQFFACLSLLFSKSEELTITASCGAESKMTPDAAAVTRETTPFGFSRQRRRQPVAGGQVAGGSGFRIRSD